MASVSYDARERRLIFESVCWPDDAPGLADAIGAFAEPHRALVVDLTRMPFVPVEVARAIVDACEAAERSGCRVQVWTPPGSTAAQLLHGGRAAPSDLAHAKAV